MQLCELAPGTAFRHPATGITGCLIWIGPAAAEVRLDRFHEIVIHGQVKGRRRERTTWSLATDVEPLEASS